MAVEHEQHEDEHDKEKVDYECREDLDDWQDADAEDHLLYDESVLGDGVGTIADAVLKEEPREHAADKPEDKWIVIDRLGLETDLEDKPEDQGGGDGKKESPDHAEIGAEVAGLEVPPCQLIDNTPTGQKLHKKRYEHSDALHLPLFTF